jgi:hypothetical protein
MQRHFSNRGEALPEVTAARTLVGRKRSGKSEPAPQAGRRATEQWFSRPAETTSRPKKKQPKRDANITTLL